MKFRCAALEFSSIQGVLNPRDRPGCPAYCLVDVLPLYWDLRDYIWRFSCAR